MIWITANRLEEALRDCEEALRLHPGEAVVGMRGIVHLKAGRLDLAMIDFNNALEQDPQAFIVLYARGIAKIRLGDGVGGEGDIAAAHKLWSDVTDVAVLLGIAPQVK